MARRVPISRIADITKLDDLGLPAVGAVTPLAKDLKVHNGKAATFEAARVGALMEAIERTSAESASGETLRASFDDLVRLNGACPVDPWLFDLPADTLYASDREFTWTRGWDFLTESPVLVPVDLVISPPEEGILRDVETNGLASGNSLLEAVTHATCELIERDAVSQRVFVDTFCDPMDIAFPERMIDAKSLPNLCGEWFRRCEDAGFRMYVYDITGEIGVATLWADLWDDHFPTEEGPMLAGFMGFGTHPDREVAAFRAISEAVQARLAMIQAARDSYNRIETVQRRSSIARTLCRSSYQYRHPFDEVPSMRCADVREDFLYLLGSLRRAGFAHCIAVNLTRPDLNIPVARVRVPSLSMYYVNKRRIGPRCMRHLL